MTEKTLWPLFSKPIFKTSIDINNLDFSNVKWANNYQNCISETQNILQDPTFSVLSKQCHDVVYEYFYGIMQADPKIEIYITESWLNKTEKDQSHHRHWHPNSIVSGVAYLSLESSSGSIKFITSQYDTLEYQITNANIYNSKSWEISPIAGDIVLFPSNVEHLVTPYYGNTPRISLSFNTFIRGEINSDPLTRLSI